jgi:hypothetical protein
MNEARFAADQAAAAVADALRGVHNALRGATSEPTIALDARAGRPPVVTPGRARETDEVRAARNRLDDAVRRFGEAIVNETLEAEGAGVSPTTLPARAHFPPAAPTTPT